MSRVNDFLDPTYEVPSKGGNYMKFQDGDNRFRALGSPILGYEWWIEADGKRKPMRITMTESLPAGTDPEEAKHFWAMPVWNYKEEKIQILEITQKSLQKFIRTLARDEDWGSPVNYDLVVTKKGQKLETEYAITPKPAKKLDEGIKKMFEDMHIDLTALYRGDDPFNESDALNNATDKALN